MSCLRQPEVAPVAAVRISAEEGVLVFRLLSVGVPDLQTSQDVSRTRQAGEKGPSAGIVAEQDGLTAG